MTSDRDPPAFEQGADAVQWLDGYLAERFADMDDELVVDHDADDIAAEDDVAALQAALRRDRIADAALEVDVAGAFDAAELERELDQAGAVDAVAGSAAGQPGRAEQAPRDGRRILLMFIDGVEI